MPLHRPLPLALAAACAASLLLPPAAAAGTSFTFPLTGRQETPPVATGATGRCVAILSGDETSLEIHCTHRVLGPIGAHIHLGAPGVAGPIIFDLGNPTSPIQATWELGEDEVAQLLTGQLYVNVHSPNHPGGEVRGQLRPDPRVREGTMAFRLLESEEVPPSGVAGSGDCAATVGGNLLALTCVHDLGPTIGAHIHIGERGVNGPIIFDLGTGESPIRQAITLSDAELATLLAGNYYVNVHTSEHPGGAIRGQLGACIENETTLCLNNERFAVRAEWEAPPESTFDTGPAHALPISENSGGFWFFRPENAVLFVQVHNGCTNNDRYWVFAAGLTDVRVILTVTDTLTGEEFVHENPLRTPFEPVQDTDAFATCP